MTMQIAICLCIWLLMLVIMATDKFPYGSVALAISVLLVITGCISAGDALLKFADKNVIIMGSMMIVSGAFSKTRAVGSISGLLNKVGGGNFNRTIRMFMIVNMLLGFFLSGAISRIAIVYPLALALCKEKDVSPSKVMFPLCVCMLADQTGIPLGGGAVTFAKYNGYLEAAGYTFGDSFRMIDPFLAKAPVAIFMVIVFMTLGLKLSPAEPARKLISKEFKEQAFPYTPKQETLIYGAFAAMCIGLVVSSYIGIEQWIFTLSAALFLVLTGALKPKEATSAIPFTIIFLYIGALIMGSALLNTGAGIWIGTQIAGLLGGKPSTFVLYLTFWLITMILTQFMNNGATANLFIPVAIMTANTMGCSALGLILCIQMASLVAYFTPMATAIMPVVMDIGGYDMKQLFKQGLVPAAINTVVGCAWVAYLFPAW